MRLWKLVLLFAAGLLLAGPALAQPQPAQSPGGFGGFAGFGGNFGGFGLSAMLANNKQLQEELKLDEEQVVRVREALSKTLDEMVELGTKLRQASPDEWSETAKKMRETSNKAVYSVLKPEQIKRFNQIENQQAGIGMFNKADVQKTLKLSDDQKSSIEGINENLQKDLRELRGFDPQNQRKRQGLQKEAMEKVEGLLTGDQKTALKDLTGAPFEMRVAAFGGGFGGGFGAGGSIPGQIMSTTQQDMLRLTPEQKKQIEEVQKEVDGKLEKILTDEQKKQIKDMKERRPGVRSVPRPPQP
jgi:hypothetical protein